MKIILDIPTDSNGRNALHAALRLANSPHSQCVFTFKDGAPVYAKKTAKSIVATETAKPDRRAAAGGHQPPANDSQQEASSWCFIRRGRA